MPLTRDFKDTVRARVERDPKFRQALLREGIEAMLAGDVATAKTILRDYINATLGFADLAEATRIPSKSLMRMLGPAGNPRADNLFEIVSLLQRRHQQKDRCAISKTGTGFAGAKLSRSFPALAMLASLRMTEGAKAYVSRSKLRARSIAASAIAPGEPEVGVLWAGYFSAVRSWSRSKPARIFLPAILLLGA